MNPSHSEISGVIQRIRYLSSDTGWAVFTLLSNDSRVIPCTGVIPQDAAPGRDRIVLKGEYQKNATYGEQFVAKSILIAPELPSGYGVVAFLDKLPHVGPVRARDIFETFGDDLWDVLENEPVRLTEVSGISEQHIDGIITAYEEMKASRDVLVKLYGFGLTEWQIRKIMDTYKGEDVVKIVTETPYRMIDDIDMFGFIRVDEIALKAGIYQDDPARIRAGVEYVVGEQSNTEGHILIAIPHLIKSAIILFSTTSAKIGTPNMVTEAMTRKGVEELISGGRLVIVDGFVAIRDLYYAEKTILEFCKEGGIANEQ